MRAFILLVVVFYKVLSFSFTHAQESTRSYEDIIIKDPYKPKPRSTYFSFSGGTQVPFWTNVPMSPTDSPDIRKKSNMEVEASGWFAGISIIKKTKSRFEAGLDFSYHRSSVPVAYRDKASVSEWVFEQNNSSSALTPPFNHDINRLNEVYSIRALCRYRIPIKNFKTWAGISGGTYSSNIYYGTDETKDQYAEFPDVSLCLGFQLGTGIVFKNKSGEEKVGLNIFGDFNSPVVNEKMISLFYPGWNYVNEEGSRTTSPARIGVSIDFH
jgi:hypothetical protein